MSACYPFFDVLLSPVPAAAMAKSSVSAVTDAPRPARRQRLSAAVRLRAIGALALAIGALAMIPGLDPVEAMDDGMGEDMPVAVVPDRTAPVEALATMRCLPGEIVMTEGETIAFVVANTGEAPHEFAIGDAEVEVAPDETASLVYTSDEPGASLRGCNVPGHYAAGMVGTITVQGA